MKEIIKGYVTSGQLRMVRRVFMDALDIDPTFEKYEEAYEYCKTVSGVMDTYEEYTPLRKDPATWDDEYWANLKIDLSNNFSDIRMCHMREVAKVIMAEKIQRLQKKRAEDADRPMEKNMPKPPMQPLTTFEGTNGNLRAEEDQKRWLEEQKRKLQQHNEEVERREAADRLASSGGKMPKKAWGIAVAVGVGAAVLVTALVLALR